jgi:hypothetical protein
VVVVLAYPAALQEPALFMVVAVAGAVQLVLLVLLVVLVAAVLAEGLVLQPQARTV